MTEEKKTKKKSWVKWVLLPGGAVVLLLAFAYFGGVYYFKDKFLPGTVIQGQWFEYETAETAIECLDRLETESYEFTVLGKEEQTLLTLQPEDVGLSFSSEEAVRSVMEGQNVYLWPVCFLTGDKSEHTVSFRMDYDGEQLEAALDQAGLFDGEDVQEPRDAYIGDYMPKEGKYELIPEEDGNQLNREKVVAVLNEAIGKLEQKVDLVKDDCYEQARVTAEDAKLQETYAQLNRMVAAKITYDWNGREEILDGAIIHQWISLEDGEILLDEEKVLDYVSEKAKAYDTWGKDRKFNTTLGVELTLPSGGYGWKTDREAEAQALAQLIREGAVTEREPEYRYTGFVKGENDIGSSYVEIDMTNQHLYVYVKGAIVLETDFVSGNVSANNTTPPGVFGITYKTTNAVLRGRTWESFVYYWMPFNGNIGMHDATWRTEFGGQIYLTDGSHGCINLPLDKAEAIYNLVKSKFPVVCYYY